MNKKNKIRITTQYPTNTKNTDQKSVTQVLEDVKLAPITSTVIQSATEMLTDSVEYGS